MSRLSHAQAAAVTGLAALFLSLQAEAADRKVCYAFQDLSRREGFMNVINKYPNVFGKPAEIAAKWNSQVALAGLEAATRSAH